MDAAFLTKVTEVLREFEQAKFASQVLEMSGPDKEGVNYRWRLVSTRYREVTVLLVTKKHFMGKPTPERFEVFGVGGTKEVAPDPAALQTFLATAELTLAR